MSLSTFSSLGSLVRKTKGNVNVNGCIVGSGYSTARSLVSVQSLPALGTIYTIEFYMRNASTGGTQESIISIGSGNNTSSIQCNFGVIPNAIQIYNTNTNGINAYSTPTFTLNTWRHIAYCKNGANMKIYVNGVQLVNTAINNNSLASGEVRIFGNFGGANPGNANTNTFVNNIRVTQKVVYTGAFTPPIQSNNLPLTQSAGTNISAISVGEVKLLLTFENNSYTDKSGNITWTLVGGGPTVSSVPTP